MLESGEGGADAWGCGSRILDRKGVLDAGEFGEINSGRS